MYTPTQRRGAARIVPLLVGALLLPSSLLAQTTRSVGVGVYFQGYTFDEALGARVANLTLIPVAASLPVGERLTLDLYSAYAHGSVEREGLTYTLTGPVDTRIRASYRVAPWAVVSAAVTLPTGNASHDAEESVVAAVLSTDILGFREASWGTGSAVTTGFATAYQAGAWGIGLGASYRLSGEFEPEEGSSLTYQPGNETRIRLGVDRNVGEAGKFTAGLTFLNYAQDEFAGRNLFQPGSRIRVDGAYAFRAAGGTWSVYVVDVWREQGDVFLDVVDRTGAVVGDTTLVVGTQNLFVAGLSGSVALGSSLRVRPSVDLRVQSREEGDGSGWLLGAGGDVPLRLMGTYDLFPRAYVSMGRLEAPSGARKSVWGVELGLTLRWRG